MTVINKPAVNLDRSSTSKTTTPPPPPPTSTPPPTSAISPLTTSTLEASSKVVVDGVDKGSTPNLLADKPAGANHPLSLVTEADLKVTLATSAVLASSSNPAVASVFAAAGAAAGRVQRATSIEIPLRLAVANGANQPQARLPQEVPGLLKERDGVVTFYPANEALRPFDIDQGLAANLPKNTLLVARTLKKSMDFQLPDGSVESAALYRVNGDGLPAPRPAFVAVIDFVAGEPFARDLVPPARLVALAPTNGGKPWQEGSVVDVAVTLDTQGQPSVLVQKELAAGGSPLARCWMVASGQRLDAVFPKAVIAEAGVIEQTAPASLADQSLKDLRHLPFFAMDNDHAHDIDQAMHFERRADGGFVLSYALADAAHYIKPGSALFDEAMQRGSSYYLPGLSIPMLPDNLSSGVVSLNAHEDHRAMVLQIRLDKDGNVEGEATLLRALIHSQAQITYNGVSAELEGQGAVKIDGHGKPVPAQVSAQLAIFQQLGELRIVKAKERGVVDPDRRSMEIGLDGSRFFLQPEKSDLASKLNAEMSILANVAGARLLTTSKIPGLAVPGLFKVHAEPAPQALQALARQVAVVVDKNGLSPAFRWDPRKEALSAWVDRIKTLPQTPREQALAAVLQTSAVRINVPAEFAQTAGRHSGLKVDQYGRFSAPMREQVGIVSHAILFAKAALENAFDQAQLTPAQATALWAPLLLGALLDPAKIPPARRVLAQQAQALLTASGPALTTLAQSLAAEALLQGPGLSPAEQQLIDGLTERVSGAGNSSKMKQGQVEGAALRLLFDDLFANDLGGNPLGNPKAPRRVGTITAVTPAKVYIQLSDPDVEVRVGLDDLRRNSPTANFHLEDEGCSLVSDQSPPAGQVDLARLLMGQGVQVQATHHDGERLHFAIVSP